MRIFVSITTLLFMVGCQTTKGPAAVINVAGQASPTASSTQVKWDGEGPVTALIDGDLATRWSSTFADASVKNPDRSLDDNQWVVFDFADTVSLTSMRVHWETAAASAYEVQTSPDGNNWTTVDTLADGKAGPRADDFDLGGVKTRYLRLKLTGRATEYGYSIYEVEIY